MGGTVFLSTRNERDMSGTKGPYRAQCLVDDFEATVRQRCPSFLRIQSVSGQTLFLSADMNRSRTQFLCVRTRYGVGGVSFSFSTTLYTYDDDTNVNIRVLQRDVSTLDDLERFVRLHLFPPQPFHAELLWSWPLRVRKIHTLTIACFFQLSTAETMGWNQMLHG